MAGRRPDRGVGGGGGGGGSGGGGDEREIAGENSIVRRRKAQPVSLELLFNFHRVSQVLLDMTFKDWYALRAIARERHIRHNPGLKALLAADGIDVNRAKKDGGTPLFSACQYGRIRSVRLLLAKEGIRVNQATHDDATSRINDDGTITAVPGPLQSVTPLRIAAQQGRLDVVRVLVEQDGIDLDKPGNTDSDPKVGFESPLQIARRNGHDAVVEVLLAAGAVDDDTTAAADADAKKWGR